MVAVHLPEAIISSVNLAEVGARLSDWGITDDEARQTIASFDITIAPFDEDLAYASIALRPSTRHRGLSLGDRSCLALAASLGLQALTADRSWAELDVGVEVKFIR